MPHCLELDTGRRASLTLSGNRIGGPLSVFCYLGDMWGSRWRPAGGLVKTQGWDVTLVCVDACDSYNHLCVRKSGYWKLQSDSILYRLVVMSVSLMFAFGWVTDWCILKAHVVTEGLAWQQIKENMRRILYYVSPHLTSFLKFTWKNKSHVVDVVGKPVQILYEKKHKVIFFYVITQRSAIHL